MFDSAEDNRPRDKFTPRDRDFNNRGRGRDDFNDNRNRRDFSNGFGGGFNKRPMAPRRDEEPNPKRNRFDSASDTYEPQFNSKEDSNAVAPLMTFRKFLMTQEDGVTDNAEAVKKYNEYKIDYMKAAAQRFFDAHKDEEWFNRKYFPGQYEKRLEERKAALEKRLTVFEDIIASGDFNFSLDYSSTEEIIRLLDIAVIKLEDGTDDEIEAARTEEINDEAITELKKLNGTQNENTPQNNGANANGANKAADLQDKKKQEAHKTSSIYFKTIPANVSVDELEKICKDHPGFLRLGLSEPIHDQKFIRHAWASYRRDVSVKTIFWSLKSVKLGNTDLGPSVNRDIRRRIRWVNGIAKHRTIAQNDLKLAAKLVVLLDYKTGLFSEDETEAPSDLEVAIAHSKNPVLDNITEYLIEEANAEEDVLLGLNESENSDAKQAFEVDDEMLKVLDKIILYLRIVHSFDFYAHLQYPNEDQMPNRLGLFHVRGVSPDGSQHGKNASEQPYITQAEIEDYINKFNEFFATLLKYEVPSEEELQKLGKKDPEKAVESFIEANTVELGKDKWLCPLSGKKFKGPEFIQKHLASKHQEQLDQERNNAIYYNNYVSDPDRPQEAEPKPQTTQQQQTPTQPPPNTTVAPSSEERSFEYKPRERFNIGSERFGRFGGGGGGFNSGGSGGFGRGGRYFDRGSGGNDRRHQPSYRDLDAPDE